MALRRALMRLKGHDRGSFYDVYDMNPLVVLVIVTAVLLIWTLLGRLRDRNRRRY
jgi:hypothetical protein